MTQDPQKRPPRDPDAPDPLDIVDDTSRPYQERLDELQRWLAGLADDDTEGRSEVEAAIFSLQAGARLQGDEPPSSPEAHRYGAAPRTDLRRYGAAHPDCAPGPPPGRRRR